MGRRRSWGLEKRCEDIIYDERFSIPRIRLKVRRLVAELVSELGLGLAFEEEECWMMK